MVMLEEPRNVEPRPADRIHRAHVVPNEDPSLATAVDALLDRSGGWRLTKAHLRRRGDPVATGVEAVALQALLDELAVELGFDLPPREQSRLHRSAERDAERLTDAIFAAAGMDARLFPNLRHQVAARAARQLPPLP